MPLGSSLIGRIKAGAGGAEDTADGQAQVRDTEDSLEVIVVQRTGDQIRLIDVDGPPGNVVPTESPPNRKDAWAAAACTRPARSGCRTNSPSWAKSRFS